MSYDTDRTENPDGQTPQDIAAALNDAGAENVYLMTIGGCEFCAAMKDLLADQIEAGVVEVLDVEEDDLALNIMEESSEGVGIPSIVVETDEGEYVPYQ
jgi:glutaredoxin